MMHGDGDHICFNRLPVHLAPTFQSAQDPMNAATMIGALLPCPVSRRQASARFTCQDMFVLAGR